MVQSWKRSFAFSLKAYFLIFRPTLVDYLSSTHKLFFFSLIYWLIQCFLPCFRGGWYQRGDGSLRLVEPGRHPVWAPDRHGESKSTKKMLSLLLRCCGMSVGVLAFNSLTLFMVVPGCVQLCARLSMCLSLFVLCVWGASWLPSLTLVLGECQGCRCDFLPQPELHLLGQGVSSPRALFAGSWSSAGLFEHADPRSAWKVKTRAALEVLELGWSRISAVRGTVF